MFDKRQLKEAYKALKIWSDWIRWLEDDLEISRSTLDTLAACLDITTMPYFCISYFRPWILHTSKIGAAIIQVINAYKVVRKQ